MAKIKHTKNELKAQQEALRRFQRFLPMLQLKKQQLQAEIQSIDNQIETKQQAYDEQRNQLSQWSRLLSDTEADQLRIELKKVNTEEGNIAGVNIPVLKDVQIESEQPDLFESSPWLDDALVAIDSLIQLKTHISILNEQRRLVSEELRTTSQRVNLFEKVKIPECKENIRFIKIFLGDEQTAAVARGKLAKKRTDKGDDDSPDPLSQGQAA